MLTVSTSTRSTSRCTRSQYAYAKLIMCLCTYVHIAHVHAFVPSEPILITKESPTLPGIGGGGIGSGIRSLMKESRRSPLRVSSKIQYNDIKTTDSEKHQHPHLSQRQRQGSPSKLEKKNFFHNPGNIIKIANQQTQAMGMGTEGEVSESERQNRRLFFSSILLSSGIALSSTIARPQPAYADEITWTASPVNKRSGISVFKAEETYNIRFITYLSRFLLSFDEECQRWWYKRAADIPRTASSEQVDATRLKQFGAFSASVEVGLQEYSGKEGAKLLFRSLLERYGKDIEDIKVDRMKNGLPAFKSSEEEKEKREIREAKRQIALLFGLLQTYQPTEDITKVLASIDNGYVQKVEVLNPGSGYAPGYGTPMVVFPSPAAGDDYEVATGRAVLKPNGRILRSDIVKRGGGYTKAPTVSVTPPIAEAFGSPFAKAAKARAFIFRDGINKGQVERIEITDPGEGYAKDEPINIRLSPPDAEKSEGAQVCIAKAILEYEVSGIEIVNPGQGYAVEKPLEIIVDPPPLTARVNLNDPLVAQTLGLDGKLKTSDIFDPSSTNSKAWKMAKTGGGGGCVGRACYDDPVVAIAYPVAENDSYKSFRKDSDTNVEIIESAVTKRSKKSISQVKINAAGDEANMKPMPFWKGGNSSSSQLLSLLPAGIGLIYNKDANRYDIVAGESVIDYGYADQVSPGKPLDPDFGPRGRSPIEREKSLDSGTLLRFYLSGALCSSGIHLILTPIDVVKTNIQTNPKKYPDPLTTFRKVIEEGGATGLFAGWIPTFVGFFIQGGVAYTTIEFCRRYYTELLGDIAANYELPIILAASFTSAVIGAFILPPSEAIRIRSVAQPDYAPNTLGVVKRIIDEEGLFSLFSAVPAFLLKEIPFVVAKFTVFDESTEYLYNTFPAARENLQLSLLVSLAGGTLGGITAAFVSNPADATISEMKKAKSDDGPITTLKRLATTGGTEALFRGLGVRMFFYTLVVSLQFLVYDAIRFSLGIGSDDLKLYLDVLGGALRETSPPV